MTYRLRQASGAQAKRHMQFTRAPRSPNQARRCLLRRRRRCGGRGGRGTLGKLHRSQDFVRQLERVGRRRCRTRDSGGDGSCGGGRQRFVVDLLVERQALRTAGHRGQRGIVMSASLWVELVPAWAPHPPRHQHSTPRVLKQAGAIVSELSLFPVMHAQDAVDSVPLKLEGLPTPLQLEQRPWRLVVARTDGGGWGARLRHRAVTGDRDGPQESWTKLERECVCYLTKKVIVRTRNKNQPYKTPFPGNELGSFSESPAQFVLQLTVTPTVPRSRLDVDLGKVALQNSQRAVNVEMTHVKKVGREATDQLCVRQRIFFCRRPNT
jgi:hypothetical protein